MTLKAAVDQLGTWAVTGVTTNIGLDDFAGAIPEASLPALLVRLSQWPPSGGGKPFDLGLSTAAVTVQVEHLLILQGAAMARPQDAYNLLALIDNYITKVKADWRLNSTLLEPLKIISVQCGLIVVAGAAYYGATFRHEWLLAL